MIGLWVSAFDFPNLGLNASNEAAFVKNADYFYRAEKGYKDVSGNITIQKKQEPPALEKQANVNAMVRAVYSHIKANSRALTFGISPQGSLANCRSGGADVDRWLSQSGYVDYRMPQIYWSDQWGKFHGRPCRE